MHVKDAQRLSLAGGLMAAAIATPALAQGGADFYKGKTVTYIVATAPGGGYDLYGRLVAEYMQKYLPGSTFVVKNMPGAGHLVGTNTIYASRPDGLTIGTFNTGLIYNQLIKADGAKFDLTKMSWIGKAATEPRVVRDRAAIADQELRRPAPARSRSISRPPASAARTMSRPDADQRPEAADQGPDRLQRQRRPARHAPRRNRRRAWARAPRSSSS